MTSAAATIAGNHDSDGGDDTSTFIKSRRKPSIGHSFSPKIGASLWSMRRHLWQHFDRIRDSASSASASRSEGVGVRYEKQMSKEERRALSAKTLNEDDCDVVISITSKA